MIASKRKVFRVWFIIIAALLGLIFILTMIMTQSKFIYNTINSMFGGERRYLKSGDPAEYQYYTTEYETKKDVLDAAATLNDRISGEGIVLLKNDNDTLPLNAGSKVSVFGRNSVDAILGGSGSNKGDTSNAVTDVNIALANAGFKCNDILQNHYKSVKLTRPEMAMGSVLTGYPICEAPLPYPQTVTDSYTSYGDAAIVFISRTGGEGFDLPRTMFWDGNNYRNWGAKDKKAVDGARRADDHYLQLDKYETDMIKEACANFDDVILVVNSASPVELGFLDDPSHYAYSDKIKAALWLGHPGTNGLNALGKVLSGEINPSGRTVDTLVRDFRKDPAWENFGNYLSEKGNRYTFEGSDRNAYFIEYREGVYVGYRYWETMAAELNEKDGSGETWYGNNVVYPFGYGLSYSDFEWTVNPVTPAGSVLDGDGKIEIEVTVKNNGPEKGKDVVQLYYTAPYTPGEVEKAHVVLGDFVKTDELAVGESKTYPLSIDVRDMASYDYANKNGNEYTGYELDAGTYTVGIMKNSHEAEATFDYSISEDIYYGYSDVNEEQKVENLFDDVSGYIDEYLSRENAFENYECLKGADSAENREVTDEFIKSWTYVLDDDENDPWYSASAPNQSKKEMSYNKTEVKLHDLIGKDYDDPLWNTLLDQLTVDQMIPVISTGNYRTLQIENIGKPLTIDADGPMGFASFMGDDAVSDTYYYASEAVLGATWNVKLAYEFGVMIGDESLVGDLGGDGRTYSGWYAPAMNIHRSQFGGRNFEYYSEDSLISGKMAAEVVKGAKSKGVYTYAKHFALNDQETNRDTTGLLTWANEQAMRELYFRPFEICVKEGKTNAMMSSFNRIGVEWTGGSYRLLTTVLRDEWGFEGMVITDFNLKTYMNVDQMLRAGGDINLSPSGKPSSTSTATDITVMRRAIKNILFTVANSNAMNGSGPNVVWGYALPYWVIWLILANVFLLVLTATLGALMFISFSKYKKSLNNNLTEEQK